jgi:serine/threonine protein kinase
MEQTIFLGHYRIPVDDSGAARELGRTGTAITYEAIDERSGENVALKLIPISNIDPEAREQFEEQTNAAARIKHVNVAKVLDFGHEKDHFVYVSELVQGEPLAWWVEQHGPMPADAVLRVAEQIVSVLSTARFHKLAYSTIQPSNLMIVPGPTPEGSWPFVKLMNFGPAEPKSGGQLEKPSEGDEPKESLSIAPQFASPESQKLSGQHQSVDFRSEVYFLGATLYFMVTGTLPLTETHGRSRELSGIQKDLRNLIANMMHRDPDQRPKDPVVLAEMIRECLLKIERRQLLARRLGIPLAAVTRRKSKTTLKPLAQVLRGIFVFAAIVLVVAVLGAFFLPDDINPFRHRTAAKESIGILIGVPEASSLTTPKPINAAPVVANQPTAQTAVPSAENQAPSPGSEHGKTSNADLVAAATPANPPEARPSTPAAAPGAEDSTEVQEAASAQLGAESQPATVSQSTSSSKKKSVASASRRAGEETSTYSQRQRTTRSTRARVVGITSDGRLIFRSSSGRTVIVTPGSENEDELAPRRRHRDSMPHPRDEIYAPSQPSAPDYFPDD